MAGTDATTALPPLPGHVPLVAQIRSDMVESVHYGSYIVLAPDGSTLMSAGDPLALYYPRSSLKPLQAVAMVRAGLVLAPELLALAAASHSGATRHLDGAQEILALHSIDPVFLANQPDLPYGTAEREGWLRAGGAPTAFAQNCSGKHAAMLATCTLNGWPLRGYLDPEHPLQQRVDAVVEELTGEPITHASTDGCGTPVHAISLAGMARAYSAIISAPAGTAEAAVADAMRAFPENVAGEGRDVTALMRAVPGLLAKDGFEGIQAVALPDGRALVLKIADGGDRARMPATVDLLGRLGVDSAQLARVETAPVLGGGLSVGALVALPTPAGPSGS
ncbi:asparaginase [Arthrobacter sp. 35W]|uniref:asparaginase n=1 Tax=Arthrobacter sp. 35W TaxID=1132441 RepID=UPI00041600C0|nr:asparaginase [Arthrobacter sp. 35W]